MKCQEIFRHNNIDNLKPKIVNWLKNYDVSCVLDSHSKEYPNHEFAYQNYDFVIAAGANSAISSLSGDNLSTLDNKLNSSANWHFGFFSYDLKNSIENLQSNNIDNLDWPDFYFFAPKILIFFSGKEIKIESYDENILPNSIFRDIQNAPNSIEFTANNEKINSRLNKQEYIDCVEKLRQHILRGDLYEVNFCQEFYSTVDFDPFSAFLTLSKISPTPFFSFFRLENKYLLTASPERFIKKTGSKIISQPIKGTAKRGDTEEEDSKFIQKLSESKKERAENIMIVDLVRNDLSKIAESNSINVDELCEIYSFKQVHQMISTITAVSKTNSIEEIINATFPMGSMTGAPKISAMLLAEKYETTKRGLYSGTVGYITPEKDFDFNVVIRGLQYNSENKYLSYMVGGAITYLSDAETEYEECMIKASAIKTLLKSDLND